MKRFYALACAVFLSAKLSEKFEFREDDVLDRANRFHKWLLKK